jgi:hypothetical protein
MGVVKRCEIKRHEPYTGDKCPVCADNEQNAAITGLLCACLLFALGIAGMVILAARLK